MPLSMVSALARLGLDPWDEAGRLSSLSQYEAVEQLARLLAELPGARRPLVEAREIAGGLIERLPKHDGGGPALSIQLRRPSRWPTMPRQSRFWVICAVVAAAALASMILHGGFPFGSWSP